jgi:fibro-slime domain-containing protein
MSNYRIRNESGYTLIVSLIFLFTVTTMGIGIVSKTSVLSNMQNNFTTRLQTFYASDGVMTTLAQELYDQKFDAYKDQSLLVSDNFERKNSDTLGNGWEEPVDNNIDKAYIYNGLAVFSSTGTKDISPVIVKKFTPHNTGTLVWTFDIDWGLTNALDEYEFLMQIGKDMIDKKEFNKVAVSLRWGDKTTSGFTKDQSFGYNTSKSAGKEITTLSGKATIKVVVKLDTKKFDVYIDENKKASNIAFMNNLNSVNEIRFGLKTLSTYKTYGMSVDNIILYKELDDANNNAAFTDTFTFGNLNIAWIINSKNFNEYTIITNSFKTGSKIHNQLKQKLNLQSANTEDDYPDSIEIPVTFYDFHSDRSNIEFEQPFNWAAPKKNLVANQLNTVGKPVRGKNCFLSYYVQYWFTDSKDINASEKVNFYHYTKTKSSPCVTGWPDEYHMNYIWGDSLPKSTYGSAKARDVFDNVVIDSSLVFKHIGNGKYRFDNQAFFYLDKRGFGPEWNSEYACNSKPNAYGHNYSYTMELHHPFIKTKDLSLEFSGDDDVWGFINDSLVLDLGGIHTANSQTITIDNIPNLKDNTIYNFDLFYCERHAAGSTISLTTNIFSSKPNKKEKKNWRRDYQSFF